MESASRVCNKGKNAVNNPFACTQNVHKTVVLPTAKNNVNGKQRIKRKSAVQKRRSSTPPFLLMLFYKPFCRANICKTDVFDFFINQRFERNFLPFVVNQRFRNWRFCRFSCVWQRNFQGKHFFARGIVFRNLQRQGFSIQIWQSHCVASSVSGVFEFMANHRLKNWRFLRCLQINVLEIGVFGVFLCV